jgi:aminopeptidase YwaD
MWEPHFWKRFAPPPADMQPANSRRTRGLSKHALERKALGMNSSTIGVPSLYLRDWPDIYIHTDHDTLDQIDATKLRRVALLGAASGYVFANLGTQQLSALLPFLTARAEGRLAQAFEGALRLVDDSRTEAGVAWYEARNLMDQALQRERATLHSLVELTGRPANANAEEAKALAGQVAGFQQTIDARARLRGAQGNEPSAPWAGDPTAKRVPNRVGEFGPLTYQNDNVLLARLGKERYVKIKLINSEASQMLNVRDQSELYAYEIVNFVNGRRSVGEIRDAVSAEYGPLPPSLVADYLDACVEAGVMQWK